MTRTAVPVGCIEVRNGSLVGYVIANSGHWVAWEKSIVTEYLYPLGIYPSRAEALRALGVKPEEEKE